MTSITHYHLTRPVYLVALAALGRAWAEHRALRYARWLELVEVLA